MKIEQAKQIQIIDLLARLNHIPTRILSNGAWYLSPLRDEKTASFNVHLKRNVWYDHGEGYGGGIIDLAMKLQNTDVKGALKYLESSTGIATFNAKLPAKSDSSGGISEILRTKRLSCYLLKRYLQNDRKIPLELGYKYLKEVNYKIGDWEGHALGFQNLSGGWELRNKFYKGGIGKKDIMVFETDSSKIHAFEGWPDFLSAVYLDKDILNDNIVVLNSVSLKSRAIKYIQERGICNVLTYFNNDKAGEKAIQAFKQDLTGVRPMNHLYQAFNDLNDSLVNNQLQR